MSRHFIEKPEYTNNTLIMKAKNDMNKKRELYYKTMSFNIVEFIESNPIVRLTDTYQSKLITKIQSEFSSEQQILFVASFYSFLNYDQKKDFIIDLDDVWKWVEFKQKVKAKKRINFIKNIVF